MKKSDFAELVRDYLEAREFSEFEARKLAEKKLEHFGVSVPLYEDVMMKLDDEWTIHQMHLLEKKRLGWVRFIGWLFIGCGFATMITVSIVTAGMGLLLPCGVIAIGGLTIFLVKSREDNLKSKMDLREYDWKQWFQKLNLDS